MFESIKMSNANIAPKSKKMTVGTLAIMNITAVVSLRFIPSEAEYGLDRKSVV